MIHVYPKESSRRSSFDPDSEATLSSSCCRSFSARTNSPAESGLKTIPPAPALLSPSSVSRVTAAVVSAKSRSRAGPASFFLPRRTSRRPTPGLRDRSTHFSGDLGECLESLLERRMRHEEGLRAFLDRRRDDEKRIHCLDLTQVALGDPEDVARDLLERTHQMLGCAGDQGRPTIRGELAVARDREDQDLAEEVRHHG